MISNAIGSNPLYEKYGYVPGAQSPGGSENMFLQILTTQLKNQDPLSPLENGDFVQQVSGLAQIQESQTLNAQLSGLLALQELVAGQNAFTQSASLVGKHVKYVDPETSEELAGLVSEVKLTDGALLLSIGGKDVPMSSVIGITMDPAGQDDAGDSAETGDADDAGGADDAEDAADAPDSNTQTNG